MNNKLAAAIAEHMGWEYFEDLPTLYFYNGRNYFDIGRWDCAKLIQQKLVDEGWNVRIEQYNGGFYINAWRSGVSGCLIEINKFSPTEPDAIFALAVKVWGIADAENK